MKNILLINTAFAPENVIGAVRTTKVAKYLIKQGHNVTVIKPYKNNLQIDNTLMCEELENIRIFEIPYSNRMLIQNNHKQDTQKSNTTIINQFSGLKGRAIKSAYSLYKLFKALSWMKNVNKHLKDTYKLDEFDFVLSSYPSLESHFAAYSAKKNGYAKSWIADYRDPIIYNEIQGNNVFLKRIQSYLNEKADIITIVSEGMRNKMGYKHTDKVFYIPNGFDKQDIESNCNNGSSLFRFAYTGNLYGGKRNFKVLFETLRSLIDKELIFQNDVNFYYAGKDFEILYNQASLFDLQGILVNVGSVDRKGSLEIQNCSNAILISTWNNKGEEGVIPGKIYEGFLLKKPIIAIVHGNKENSEISKMIDNAKNGFAYEEAKSNQVDFELFIYNLIKNGNEEEFLKNINEEYINKFDYSNITKQIVSLMSYKN